MNSSYWIQVLKSRISRRRAIAATGGLAATAAFLTACGGGDGGDDSSDNPTPVDQTPEDPGEPRVGGTFLWQSLGDPGGGLELIESRNNGVLQMASLTHDGLMDFAYGLPQYPGIGTEVLPSLAQALPEISPDKLTVTFKLKPSRWHNGDDVTSEDVLWTYNTLAFADESAYKRDFTWMDSFEAPDASTLVMHLKHPNADVLQSLAVKASAGVLILNPEHHESGAAENSLMGSGPFLFEEYSPPTLTRYRRNPDYMTDPGKPYFEEIVRLGTADTEKRVSDIMAGQVHLTYWFRPEQRDRILDRRSDLQKWHYQSPGAGNLYFRNDKAPFNDKRVRQALSMGYDRELLIEQLSSEGSADQALSHSGAWDFRRPEDLPRADLYELNIDEAKKLLNAAGVDLPLRVTLPTWNATVIGQPHVDEITSITTQWRNHGLVDADLTEHTFGDFSPALSGAYDHVMWGPNTTSTLPNLGTAIRDKYWSPPEGPTPAPTSNTTYVHSEELNELVNAQLMEFDREARLSLFRQIEEWVSEEMVHASGINNTQDWFGDPRLRNAQMPRDAYNGAVPWMRHWWFADD